MTPICCVYRLVNVKTGECYIGGTRDLRGRIKAHKYRLRHDLHTCKKLQAAWNLYGETVFSVEVLQECERHELRKIEVEMITKLNSCAGGYNSTPQGAGYDYEYAVKHSALMKQPGACNTSGLRRDALSEEGRRRRSETMKRLNATGKCGFNAPGVKEKALATRKEKHGY